MEPKSHPIEKEHNLPSSDSILNFPGSMGLPSIFRDITVVMLCMLGCWDHKQQSNDESKLVESLRCGFVLAWGLDLQGFGQQEGIYLSGIRFTQ